MAALRRGRRVGAGEFGEPGSQDPVVDAGEEHGAVRAGGGDLVAVGVRDALDESVLGEPAQVVGGQAGGDRSGAVGRAAGVFAGQAAQVLRAAPGQLSQRCRAGAPRVVGDEQENPGVISQEGPARHLDRWPVSGKNLLVSWCGYSLALGTGRQPPSAASFPGLPEEQMRTDAVNTVAGAHDAHDAASRLTMPVPDASSRAGILAWQRQ